MVNQLDFWHLDSNSMQLQLRPGESLERDFEHIVSMASLALSSKGRL